MPRPCSPSLRIASRFSSANDATLFHGDCLSLIRDLPKNSVDLVVTSPPYNLGKDYEKQVSFSDYMGSLSAIVAETVRVVRTGGSICWQVGPCMNDDKQLVPLDLLLYPVFSTYKELVLRNRIVWHYGHGLNCSQRFSGRYEVVLWFTKGEKYCFNLDSVRVPQKYPGKKAYKGPRRGKHSGHPLGKNPGDVWIFPNVKSSHLEKSHHPCQFPIELPERLILALTNKRDLVLDPYLGVGSTAIAALMHGRRVVGADLVKSYLEVARKRIEHWRCGTLRYRRLGTAVYEPQPNTALTVSPFRRRLA